MLVTLRWWQNRYFGDVNYRFSFTFRALKLGVTIINRLQHPTPTSMKPLRLKPPVESDVKNSLLHQFTLPISMLAFANQNSSFSWLSFQFFLEILFDTCTFMKAFIMKYRSRWWNSIFHISKANSETEFMPDFDFFNGPSSELIEVRSSN